MAHLTLTFLGTFHVTYDDQVLTAFATDKARGLLAFLAVETGRPHSRAALAGLLWPDQPEERARQSLRQTLLYVRQALGPAADRLQVDRDVVELRLDADDQVDVAVFTRLSDTCRRHSHRRGDGCLPCLRRHEALAALYQGEFLAGFYVDNSDRFEEWAVLKREWLHRQAIESIDALTGTYERRGDLRAAREMAHRHVALEPWSEEAHRALMALMAREGNRSGALAQFEVCRRALAAELGVEPTAQTQALRDAIQRGEGASPPSAPTPLPLSPPVGRASELAELAEILASPYARLVTLVGPGGIGKTHLALQSAYDHTGVFRDGVVVTLLGALGGDVSEAGVGAAIVEALGLSPGPTGDPWSVALDYLRQRELLLVLDNLEHLLGCPDGGPDAPTCADRIARLLKQAPGLVILATSRERLRLVEEQVYELEGLAYPASTTEPDPQRFGAVALFVERARQVQRRFALDHATLPDVLRICAAVGGMPLGLELAAATLAERPLAEIGTTLDTMVSPLRDIPPRHRSLRAAFEHSWALLAEYEQHALAVLSVFAGPFDAAAASAVLDTPGTPALAALSRKSLLRRTEDGRFVLHSTITEFAAGKLASDPEGAALARARHAAAYADLARRLEPELRGTGATAAARTIRREHPNWKIAWNWAVEHRRSDLLASLLGALGLHFRLAGPLPEGIALLHSGDQPGMPGGLRARLRIELARLLSVGAHFDEALAAAEDGLRLAIGEPDRAIGEPDRAIDGPDRAIDQPDLASEAEAHLVAGQILVQRGDYEAARVRLAVARDLVKGIDRPLLAADVLRELANIANRQSAVEEGRTLYNEALSIYRARGDLRGETAILNNLGALEQDAGNQAASRALLEQALARYRELGDDRGAAKALNNLANAAADEGAYGEALARYGEALHLLELMGNSRGQSALLNNRGTVYWAVGRYAEAGAHYRRALRIYRESGNDQAVAETLANLALLAYSTGDYAAAVRTAEQAIAISESYDDISNLANAWTYRAKAHSAMGQLEAAEASLQSALRLRGEALRPGAVVELHAERAYLAHLRQQPQAALTLIEPVLAALLQDADLVNAEDPLRVHWICHEILSAAGDPRAAGVLERARATLLARADHLADPELRTSFLESIALHRALLAH